ncbi:MAG: carboxymuconolactone decarboxylase family protein [Saprospiraceae bacterium]|nr:carboxymuconolactone decarboxylase family protein [Saprospiraceae bacterium]
MPATKILTKEQVEGNVKDVFNRAENHFGRIPNLVKVLATNPSMCTSITDFLIQSLGPGRVDWGFKELIILKTLRVMGSFYSYGAHERLAMELGVSEDKIGDLANSIWKSSPHYNEAEKVVFELVEQIGIDANDVSNELWDRLRNHWDNGQLLEINAVITTFIMIGRVADTLGVSDPVLFTKDVI